jgi:hypothetical protein
VRSKQILKDFLVAKLWRKQLIDNGVLFYKGATFVGTRIKRRARKKIEVLAKAGTAWEIELMRLFAKYEKENKQASFKATMQISDEDKESVL